MFAAMAQGDGSAFSGATFDAPSFSAASSEAADPVEDPTRNLFAKAAMEVDSSGTFHFQDSSLTGSSRSGSDKPARSFVKNHNLEAAAAALADDDDPAGAAAQDASMPAQGIFATQNAAQAQAQAGRFPKLAPRTPMHTQQVYLPKPLFFGWHLPPHVVKEARQIVKSCPKDKPLPTEVRNLLSAIRTYGHGLDLLKDDSKPTPYVSVYCPKWSEVLPPAPPSDDPKDETVAGGGDPAQSGFSNSHLGAATAASAASLQDQHRPDNAPGQSSGEEGATASTASSSVDATKISERDLFSMWARGDGGAGGAGGADGGSNSPTNTLTSDGSTGQERKTPNRESSMGSISASRRNSGSDSAAGGEIMSDRDLFSQWARGESPREEGSTRALMGNGRNSMVFNVNASVSNNSSNITMNNASAISSTNDSVVHSGSVNFFHSGTFMNLPAAEDSDDDELVVSELKKKVGVNEHLNAALAYLEEDQNDNRNLGENAGVEDSANKLAQVPLTADGGRPLTNHELMNGIAPLFGCDDSPLPTEADLGVHETKDEQQRSRDQRRNQAIIENFCPQNIFGPLACPNPAMHPDDNHSWNSRATPPTQSRVSVSGLRPNDVPRTVAHAKFGVLPNPDGVRGKPPSGPRNSARGSSAQSEGGASATVPSALIKVPHLADKKLDPRSRYGWWNVPDDEEPGDKSLHAKTEPAPANKSFESSKTFETDKEEQLSLQLPPLGHSASNVMIQTKLEPLPEKLQEQNRPLSQLHPATTFAQSLPFLSDRPPSYRYLQIDTQAVGFLGLGGEVEPLFCSLAIHHVETIAPNTTKDPSLAPIPDLQRCGKVTETLNFDVVSDPTVEGRCRGALWPYSSKAQDVRLQGTRCGVFPLPSNLNIHNLYAILIVHKVVSEGSDFEAYLRPGQTASKGAPGRDGGDQKVDLELLRNRAEKASNHQGKFIMPFAFGVAPLLQVFGADVPVVPSSRAVQIPLFRFSAGLGDRQIIDHIMVMLYPR